MIIESVLKGIFNLSVSLQLSPKSWKQSAIPSTLEKSITALPRICLPIYQLSSFSLVFGFVVHDHLSHCFRHKLNSFQNSFLKNKYTLTTAVPCLDYVSPNCQEVVNYCDLSSEIDLVMHFITFKLCAFGLLFGFLMSHVFP